MRCQEEGFPIYHRPGAYYPTIGHGKARVCTVSTKRRSNKVFDTKQAWRPGGHAKKHCFSTKKGVPTTPSPDLEGHCLEHQCKAWWTSLTSECELFLPEPNRNPLLIQKGSQALIINKIRDWKFDEDCNRECPFGSLAQNLDC